MYICVAELKRKYRIKIFMIRYFSHSTAMEKNKKRTVIVKVSADKFVKYQYVNNLPLFVKFLFRQYPGWCFMNVFDRETEKQIASFTNKNLPASHI